MKKCLLSFIILIASTLLLPAQNRQFQGKVTDDTGAPLAGVSVLVNEYQVLKIVYLYTTYYVR